MLARGWLAYPVTSIHSHLPPKSGCICQHIPRFALSRRRATALFRNPVCKAQRSVPGFSSTPNSACRRYATSPPSIGLRIHIVRHHHLIAPTAQYTAIGEKPPKSGCINVIPRFAYPVTPCAIRRERSLRFPEAPLFALINYCFLTA